MRRKRIIFFLALWMSGVCGIPVTGETGKARSEAPLIDKAIIQKLHADHRSTASIRSTVEKRRVLRRVVQRSASIVEQHPDAPNRFQALSAAFKARKELFFLKSDRQSQAALLETAGALREAPDAYARERLPADIMLLQIAFRRERAAPRDQVARIGKLVDRYAGTPAEGESLITASDMLFDLGDAGMLDKLQSKMLRDFTLDPTVADFLRTRFGYSSYSVRFSGAFKRVDGRVLNFPMDRLGHVHLSCYWSVTTPDLEERLMEIKALQDKYPGAFEVFSFNLDELPDAGQSRLDALGLDGQAMHLPSGPNNPYFRCYGTDPQFLVRVTNANGYLSVRPMGSVLKHGFQGSSKKEDIMDLDAYFEMNREHPQTLAQVQSLLIGDFLILDPFKPFDGARPPELPTRQPHEQGAVPAETLQAIQACFTPPPERYVLPREVSIQNYEKARRLCAAALETYPAAPNRWVVYNRGMIALLGLWNLRGDPACFEAAVEQAREVLAMPPPPGTDLVARFCLAKQAIREHEGDFDRIAADFEAKAVKPDQATTVGAAAILAMDAGSSRHLEEYSGMLFDHHMEDPRLWSLISLLADPPVAGRLLRANENSPEARSASRYGGGSWNREIRHRELRLAFKALDGSTLTVPGKDPEKYDVVMFFDLADSEQCENLQIETFGHFEPGVRRFHKLPTNQVHFVRAFITEDVDAVKKWVKEMGIKAPVVTVPGGYRNPYILRLGVIRAKQQPNAFIVHPDGTAIWSKTGRHLRFDLSDLSRGANRAAMFNRLDLAYRSILENRVAKARGLLQEGVPSSSIRSFLNGALACIDVTEENRAEKLSTLDDLIGRSAYYNRRFLFSMGVTHNIQQFERNALAAWLTARSKIYESQGRSEEARKDRARAEALTGPAKSKAAPEPKALRKP